MPRCYVGVLYSTLRLEGSAPTNAAVLFRVSARPPSPTHCLRCVLAPVVRVLVHVAAGRQVERDTLVHDLVRGRGFSQVGVCDAAVHGAGRAGATDGGVGRCVWWVSVGVEEAGVHSRVHVGCWP